MFEPRWKDPDHWGGCLACCYCRLLSLVGCQEQQIGALVCLLSYSVRESWVVRHDCHYESYFVMILSLEDWQPGQKSCHNLLYLFSGGFWKGCAWLLVQQLIVKCLINKLPFGPRGSWSGCCCGGCAEAILCKACAISVIACESSS